MNLFQNISSKKLIAGLALLIVAAAIPLTVYIAQKQQDIRQKAAGEETSLYFTQGGDCSSSPVSQISLIVGQQSTLSFCLDTGANPISGFDVIVQNVGTAQSLVSMNSLNEGEGAQRFPSEVFKRMENGAVHFAKVTTDTSNLISGKLRLAMATFTPTTVTTSGNITVSEAIVTSAASPTALSVSKPTLTYSIGPSRGGPTGSPTPTGIQAPLSASITGPTAGNTGQPLQYKTSASGQNLRGVEIFRAKVGSDITKKEAWTNVASNLSCNNAATCSTSGSFTPSENGQYYVAVNAYELNNARVCSGNPAVKDGRITGWAVCGPNDLITLIVGGASTPTPPESPVAARFIFTLLLRGIEEGGNISPRNPSLPIEVEVFDSNNNQAGVANGQIDFNNQTKRFHGTIILNTLLNPGSYTLKVTVPKYLTKQIPGGIQKITAGRASYDIPEAILIVGDADGNNTLNITDYNMILSCLGDKANTSSCVGQNRNNVKDSVDFDDNGIINGVDLNLFIRSLAVREGD